MDPVAHTLVGAALAECGLRHRSRLATATLLIGANVPDIDVVAGLWGSDMELYVRRGISHGVLAMVLLPLALAGGIAAWHRWRGDRSARPGPAPPQPAFRFGVILALAYLAVWSHPLLDWLNTYGVRLLMPFDGRWFYGDTLFIVDPWLWLLAAAGVVIARSSTKAAISAWVLLAAAASALILATTLVPAGVKVAWVAMLAVVVVLRSRLAPWATSERIARAGVGTLALYIGVGYGVARVVESATLANFPGALEVQANPEPGVPFSHRLVVVGAGQYSIVGADGAEFTVPRRQPDAIVESALADPSIRGFVNWMRYPAWTIEDAGANWLVRIQDLRYQGPDIPDARTGIGMVQVEVPKASVR